MVAPDATDVAISQISVAAEQAARRQGHAMLVGRLSPARGRRRHRQDPDRAPRRRGHDQPLAGHQKVAILMAMTVGEQIPLADVKNRLSEVVDRLEREHGRVVITKHGRPAAVVISVDDLESLEETLDVMGTEALLADIREALAELATGEAQVLSKDEALSLIPHQ